MTKTRDFGTRYIWYDKVGILGDLIIVPIIQPRRLTILSEDGHGIKVKSPLFLFLLTFFFLSPPPFFHNINTMYDATHKTENNYTHRTT